jgi:hypothetical protein
LRLMESKRIMKYETHLEQGDNILQRIPFSCILSIRPRE